MVPNRGFERPTFQVSVLTMEIDFVDRRDISRGLRDDKNRTIQVKGKLFVDYFD